MVNIPQIIVDQLKKENVEKNNNHNSSRCLSAGKLSLPLQWQVLHHIGIEEKPPAEKMLGKFTRGNIYEDEIVRLLSQVDSIHSQCSTVYRGCIGYLDVLFEDYPIEIKTIDSNQWKRLKQSKWGHTLQAACYSLALEKPAFGVLYVKPDTFETKIFNHKTSDWKEQVDNLITQYANAIEEYEKTGYVPGFQPREHWHKAISANRYPQFAGFEQPFKLV